MSERIGARYTLRERLGSGAFGEVYAAWDELALVDVAIKLITFGCEEELERIRREVAALRLLDDPGVIRLQDDGLHEGRYFLVMDLIDGAPFPGLPTPCTWAAIRDRVVLLLTTLARVHEAGIMHRDIKPANILVTPAGRPVLLDFGVSGGPSMGRAITARGSWVGTPQYFSPEQLTDVPSDYRTDLYGVGLILYEALSGVLPHVGGNFTELVMLRSTAPPRPLDVVAPGVPPQVAEVVMRLLARKPHERPEDARAVLAMLEGDGPLAAMGPLRWLGSREPIDNAIVELAAGTSVAVTGAVGTGRARLIEEVVRELVKRGVEVRWLAPGARPFASVAGVVGLEDAAHETLSEARAAVVEGLRARLREGVVAIRRAQHLDEWTRDALLSLREAGPILSPIEALGRVVVPVGRISEDDLRELFCGPDLLLHLREDGARLMWERTQGRPSEISHEASAWVHAGLATWSDDRRLIVTRQSLDRLIGDLDPAPQWRDWHVPTEVLGTGPTWTRRDEALELCQWLSVARENVDLPMLAEGLRRPVWEVEALVADLEASGAIVRDEAGCPRLAAGYGLARTWSTAKRQNTHGVLADRLEPGAKARVTHLIAAGRLTDAGREAAVMATRELEAGRLGLALVTVEAGLVAARADEDGEAERELLGVLVRLSCLGSAVQGLDRALYEIGRAGIQDEGIRRLEALARGCRNVCETTGEAHVHALGMLEPFDDPELERWRHAYRVRASRSAPEAVAAAVLDDAEAWATATGDARSRALVATWRGFHAYRLGDYTQTVALGRSAIDGGTLDVTTALNARIDVASAHLELGDLDRAEALAVTAARMAAEVRHCSMEARAVWLHRMARYRRGDPLSPDVALAAAGDHVGRIALAGVIHLTESAIAWRAGQYTLAATLAGSAVERLERANTRWAKNIAKALRHAAQGACSDEDHALLCAEAGECPVPEIAIQIIALSTLALGRASAALLTTAAALHATISEGRWSRRLDVMSPTEALDAVAQAAYSGSTSEQE